MGAAGPMPLPQQDLEMGSPDKFQPSSPPASSILLEPASLLMAVPRAIAELIRRAQLEFTLELPMLLQRWRIIVFGLVMQYVHGLFTQLAHRMHTPQEQPLHDVGFALTPELGPEWHWLSESIFGSLFALFLLWTFSPFVRQRKKFYTAVLWGRLLMVLVTCQALRIITFSSTQLPGPSFHCRAGAPTSRRPWPAHWTGHLVIDPAGVTKSCGDLLFSSHTIFMLTGVLAYTEYGSWLWMKFTAWGAAALVSYLIVCSRKHYTVDVVVAWYTVPMVFFTLGRRWTTRRPMSDFLAGRSSEFDEITPDWVEELEMEQVQLQEAAAATVHVALLKSSLEVGMMPSKLAAPSPAASSSPPSRSGSVGALSALGQRLSYHQRKGSSSSPPADAVGAAAFVACDAQGYAGGGGGGGTSGLSHPYGDAGTGGGWVGGPHRAPTAPLSVRPRSSVAGGGGAAGEDEEGGVVGRGYDDTRAVQRSNCRVS